MVLSCFALSGLTYQRSNRSQGDAGFPIGDEIIIQRIIERGLPARRRLLPDWPT
jgi:hypothetical protein